jgi:hypothetical protein
MKVTDVVTKAGDSVECVGEFTRLTDGLASSKKCTRSNCKDLIIPYTGSDDEERVEFYGRFGIFVERAIIYQLYSLSESPYDDKKYAEKLNCAGYKVVEMRNNSSRG